MASGWKWCFDDGREGIADLTEAIDGRCSSR